MVLGTVAGWHSSTVAHSGMPYRASKLSGCATKRRVGCGGRERRNQGASKDLHPQVSHCGDRNFWALAAVAKGGSNSPPTNKKG